jgi:hypothetical protein
MSPALRAMARRAFWSRLYARRRLGTERAHALAPLHYALVGERRGYRPNGFFDPDFFRKAAGLASNAGGLMERYLAEPEAGVSPSAEFDHAWYASQNPDWMRTQPHPLLHFLESGLREGRRPRADIDMGFVRDVIRGKGLGIEEAALRVFDPKPRDGDLKPPLSREELRARQDRFYADGRMRIVKEPADRGRKFLVFVQSGKGFDAPYLSEPRDYDVLLNLYQEGGEANPRADAVVVQAGVKTTAIRRLLSDRPDLLLRYEAALFLDDDVEIDSTQIDLLFRTMASQRLDLAQPALTADSGTAWPFLKKPAAGEGILRVSTVEIMAPAFSRRALECAGWTFAESVSGWGTDLLLGPAVRAAFGPSSVGVVGAVAVRHARPVDTRGGAFYGLLKRYGVDPAHEANRVAADFGVERYLRLLKPGETGPLCRLPSVPNAAGEGAA